MSKCSRVSGHHSPIIVEVFRICSVAKHSRLLIELRFTMTLSVRATRYVAITGPQAATLTVGDIVHVHGCFLLRRSRPVLVVCSLKPLDSVGKWEAPKWR